MGYNSKKHAKKTNQLLDFFRLCVREGDSDNGGDALFACHHLIPVQIKRRRGDVAQLAERLQTHFTIFPREGARDLSEAEDGGLLNLEIFLGI